MASKKPAKKNVSNTPQKSPEMVGKAVKYMAQKGAQPFSCPSCNRKLMRGIIYEHKTEFFCSKNCIPKEIVNVNN